MLKIYADPHQLFSTIQKMQKENFCIEEFQQTVPRLTQMATSLFDAFNNRTLKTYPVDDLKLHALNAIAVEGSRGYVLKKEIAAGKIDALISLGMALRAAIEHGRDNLQATRGFNRALHVSRERLKAMQARTVYIGQTLGTPASVVLPESGGAVNVLGAFVSEGMSLERHLLTVVRPWLLAKGNLSQDRVLGVHEETDSWDLIQILERTIGGVGSLVKVPGKAAERPYSIFWVGSCRGVTPVSPRSRSTESRQGSWSRHCRADGLTRKTGAIGEMFGGSLPTRFLWLSPALSQSRSPSRQSPSR